MTEAHVCEQIAQGCSVAAGIRTRDLLIASAELYNHSAPD